MSATQDNSVRLSPWYHAALAGAVVAGGLSLVACAMMVWSWHRLGQVNPLDAPEVARLKEALRDDPTDAAARDRVHAVDRRLRGQFLRQQTLLARGAAILPVFIVAFLMTAKVAAGYRKKPPVPCPEPDPAARSRAVAAMARWSVAAVGVAVGASALAWAVSAAPPPKPAGTTTPPAVRWPSADEIARNWPRFRGPGGLGISAYDNAPVAWDGKSGRGIVWRAAVPLDGHSSPVVWQDRVFLTGADAKKREVYCFDARTGRLLWRRPVTTPVGETLAAPEVWDAGSYAAPTGLADGQRFYAIFANGDVACFDFSGRELWTDCFGPLDNGYGHASSLAMHGELLLIQLDQGQDEDGPSKMIALSGLTGELVWERARKVGSSWTSPIVIRTPAGAQVIACGNPFMIAHDPRTGRELWKAKVCGADLAPSPVYGGGFVLGIDSGSEMVALRPPGAGAAAARVAWKTNDLVPDIASPLCDGRRVYVAVGETAACYDLTDGKKLWEKDLGLEEGVEASPSLAGKRVYMIGKSGRTVIFAAAGRYREIGRCELGEQVTASPAFMNGRIYIRGGKHLYCIGDTEK